MSFLVQRVFAQASDIVGEITSPLPGSYGSAFGTSGSPGGIILFLTNVIRLIFVMAGVYALINFIMAGYQYMSAGGDSKVLSSAWARIWQTLLGLIVIVSSFVLAAIFGQLIFGRADFILNPVIYGPNQ